MLEKPRATLALNIGSGVVLFFAATWFSYTWFHVKTLAEPSARMMHTVEIVPTELAPGDAFEVHVDQTMTMLCPFEIHWSFVRQSDFVEAVSVVEPVRPARTTPGRINIVNTHYIPADFAPGEYSYLTRVLDLCPGHTYISTAKSVRTITVR